MNVLVTIALIVIVAMWAITVYSRLVRLRSAVAEAWQRLETDQANAAARKVYNDRVNNYNTSLEVFPAYLVAPLAGLRPARPFNP